MVAVVAAHRDETERAFVVGVSPSGHVEAEATGGLVTVNDVVAQASDVEAQIVVALSTYRYVSELSDGRRAQIRRLHLDGTLGPVLWRYTPQPCEEPRVWQARVKDLRALREQLQVELTMVAAGCPLMIERVPIELVAIDDPRCRVRV